MSSPRVAILMGSSSDKDTMRSAAEILERFGVPYEMKVLSAHRQAGTRRMRKPPVSR